jgi:hypothetical protein
MPQVQLLDNAGASLRVLSLTGDGLAIGRAETNDLPLPDESVSEEHAFIDWDGRQVTITDLGSKNGTAQLCRAHRRAVPVLIWSPSMPAHGAAPTKPALLRRPEMFRRLTSIGWN